MRFTLPDAEPPAPVFDCERHGPASMRFRCPKCGEWNRHGITLPRPGFPTHRAAHCGCWPHGYFVRLADPLPRSAPNRPAPR
jgi:hypothetical protein